MTMQLTIAKCFKCGKDPNWKVTDRYNTGRVEIRYACDDHKGELLK